MVKSFDENFITYIDSQIQQINKYWKNSLIAIEPTHEISKRSEKKEFFRKFNSDYFKCKFKITNVESVQVTNSMCLVTYNLKKNGIFSSKYQEIIVAQESPEPLSVEEVEEKIQKSVDKFDKHKLAYWDTSESVTIVSLDPFTNIAIYVEKFTF